MKSHVSFLLDVLSFRIILRLAETLHICFELFPMPVRYWSETVIKFLCRSRSLKESSGSIKVQVICTFYPFSERHQIFMLDLFINIHSATCISSMTLVLESTRVLFIYERKTLTVSNYMGDIGINHSLLAFETHVESSNCQV